MPYNGLSTVEDNVFVGSLEPGYTNLVGVAVSELAVEPATGGSLRCTNNVFRALNAGIELAGCNGSGTADIERNRFDWCAAGLKGGSQLGGDVVRVGESASPAVANDFFGCYVNVDMAAAPGSGSGLRYNHWGTNDGATVRSKLLGAARSVVYEPWWNADHDTLYYDTATDVPPSDASNLVFGMSEATPNPAQGATGLRFVLPSGGKIGLGLYDVSGRLIRMVSDGERRAGVVSVRLDLDGLASGLYFVKLDAPEGVITRKFSVVR